MRGLAYVVCIAGIVPACGDDAAPPDAAPDGLADRCIYVDGRGSGDGSRADPFDTLDEALDVATEGDTICLLRGEHRVPSGALDVALTIEGESSTVGSAELTVVSGGLDECPTASVPNAFRAGTVSVGVGIRATAPLTLRRVAITTCPVGVFATAALTLEDVVLDRVRTGAIVDGAVGTIRGGTLRPGSFGGEMDSGVIAAGVHGANRATLDIRNIEATLASGALGIFGNGGSLTTSNVVIEDGSIGVLWDADGDPAAHVTLGAGTTLRNHVEVSELPSGGVLTYDTDVDVDGLSVEGSDGCALALSRGTGSIQNASLSGSECGLFVGSADVTIGTDVAVEGGLLAVYATTARDGEPASQVRVTGSLATRGAGAAHVAMDRGTTFTVSGAVTVDGGTVGLILDNSRVSVSGSLRIDGSSEIGVVVTDGGVLEAANLTVSTPGALAALATRNSTVTLQDSSFRGGLAGLWAQDSNLRATDVAISGSQDFGVHARQLDGTATTTLHRVTVRDGAGLGVYVRNGAGMLTDCVVQGHAAHGLEVRERADVSISNSEFRENTRHAIAFHDASGSITDTTFGGTLPSGGRADEVFLRAESGTTRELTVGANHFEFDVARDCTANDCGVFLADGPDAVGIVMPNCLVATAPEAMTRTLVDQNGATFTIVGPVVWADLLAGRASDPGWSIAGATSAFDLVFPTIAAVSVPEPL